MMKPNDFCVNDVKFRCVWGEPDNVGRTERNSERTEGQDCFFWNGRGKGRRFPICVLPG